MSFDGKSEEENELSSMEPGLSPQTPVKKIVKPVSERRLRAFQKQLERRGVVYISRISPGLTLARIRELMSHHGEIDRIYLTPQETRSGSRKGKDRKYKDGWVEFVDRQQARLVALSLNCTPIGGPRKVPYRNDLWNLKYLPKFKWHHLTEQLAYERAERSKKLRISVSEARKANELYLKRVEQSKKNFHIQRRQTKRSSGGLPYSSEDLGACSDDKPTEAEPHRTGPQPSVKKQRIWQRKPIKSSNVDIGRT